MALGWGYWLLSHYLLLYLIPFNFLPTPFNPRAIRVYLSVLKNIIILLLRLNRASPEPVERFPEPVERFPEPVEGSGKP